MLIGLGHKRRVGKDTVADYLCRAYGFEKMSFAQHLKEVTKLLFGWRNDHVYGQLKDQKDPYFELSPRHAMQELGTTIRDLFGEDFWVETVDRRLRVQHCRNVVISDCRFLNEVQMIQRHGGLLWKIVRPPLEPRKTVWWKRFSPQSDVADQHRSETALDSFTGWNAVIYNTGSEQSLRQKVDRMMKTYLKSL